MNDILEIKNLNLSAGKLPLLKDINLTVQQGKVLGIAGESGSGKSMTCLAIMQLLKKNLRITSGEVLLAGKDLLQLSPKEMEDIRGREISMVMQNPIIAFDPLMTIGDHFAETLAVHFKMDRKEARQTAIECLKKMDLPADEDFLDKYPFQMSGGQLQRVMMAMCLSGKAKLILADEPTTALDVIVQKQILDELLRIKHEYNTSIIIVTHNLNVLSYIADEIAVMYYGQVVEQAKKDEFFRNPLHPYTKALMNSQPRMDSVRLNPIPGYPPAVGSLPETGCAFYDRCSLHEDICKEKSPELLSVLGHSVRCFKAGEGS